MKKIISLIVVIAFIFTQSGIGTGLAYAASGKQQNLRSEATAEAAGGNNAKALGEEIRLNSRTNAAGNVVAAAVGGLPVLLPAGAEKIANMLTGTTYGPDKAKRIADQVVEKGIKQPKRGKGDIVAHGLLKLRIEDKSAKAEVVITKQNDGDGARNTTILMSKGVEFLSGHINLPAVKTCLTALSDKFSEKVKDGVIEISVQFHSDHDRLMNIGGINPIEPEEDKTIEFDTDTPETMMDIERTDAENEVINKGLHILYGIGLLHEFYHILGADQETALLKVIEFYEGLKPEEQDNVKKLLALPYVDNANNFLNFLITATTLSDEEKKEMKKRKASKERLKEIELLRKKLAVARLRRAELFDNAYPDKNIAEDILEPSGERVKKGVSLSDVRRATYESLSQDYIKELEAWNAQRIADEAQEEGLSIVVGTLGRAGLIEQILMAASKALSPEELKAEVGSILRDFKEMPKNIHLNNKKQLQHALGEWEKAIGTLTELSRILSDKKVPMAQIEGRIEDLVRAMRKFEHNFGAAIDALSSKQASTIAKEEKIDGDSQTRLRLAEDLQAMRGLVDSFVERAYKIKGVASLLPQFDSIISITHQRLSPESSLHLFLANRLLDPYLGETDDMKILFQEGGHNSHVTAIMEPYIRPADHIIESLPAWADYKVEEEEGQNYRILPSTQRDPLEIACKTTLPEHIAEGIEDVMQSEHVAIAREMLVESLGIDFEREIGASIEKNPNLDRKEAIRHLLNKKGMDENVTYLAILIDKTYWNLADKVAQYIVDEDKKGIEVSRAIALRAVLAEDKSDKNFLLNVTTPEIAKQRVHDSNLSFLYDKMHSISRKRTKSPKTVHFLTTLGPGEVENQLIPWLEQAMALYLVCRDKDLNDAVEKRITDYRVGINRVALEVVEEFGLEGELIDMMLEEGLDASDTNNRLKTAGKLFRKYAGASKEVARICVLSEYEQAAGKTDLTGQYLRENDAELEKEALPYIIKEFGLEEQIAFYSEKLYRISTEEAARRIIMESDSDMKPLYEKALDARKRHIARAQLISKLRIGNKAEKYLREHTDLAKFTARTEVVGKVIRSGELSRDIFMDPRYRYEAEGPYKKFNSAGTHSRIDLGEGQRKSVEGMLKDVGADSRMSLNYASALYNLFNKAGTTDFESNAMAAFFKTQENFFARGGVFYLSLGEGINIDAFGLGNFEEFMWFSNQRGDRLVLPTGEAYFGFCVPKEFFLIYAVMIAAVDRNAATNILINLGVPQQLIDSSYNKDNTIKKGGFLDDLRESLKLKATDALDWEKKANEFFKGKFESYFEVMGDNGFIANMLKLPHILSKWSIALRPDSVEEEKTKMLLYQLAEWANKKLQGLEQINRIGPYRKAELITKLIKEAYQRKREKNIRLGRPEDEGLKPLRDLVYMCGAPYKAGTPGQPITDARLASSAHKIAYYGGLFDLVAKYFDPEARQVLKNLYEEAIVPGDFRLAGTVTKDAVFEAIPGLQDLVTKDISKLKDRLYQLGLDDTDIKNNCINEGAMLHKWVGLSKPITDDPALEQKRKELLDDESAHRAAIFLATEERDVIQNYEHAIQGCDVFDLALPDPDVLDLIDDMPKWLALAERGNENGIVVFADGAVGAKYPAFSFRGPMMEERVKLLFALDDTAVYGCLGYGDTHVKKWREDMERERDRAKELYDAIIKGNKDEARRIYNIIAGSVKFKGLAKKANRKTQEASGTDRWDDRLGFFATALTNVEAGLPLENLDFATWLILGGRFMLYGQADEQGFENARKDFDEAITGMSNASATGLPANVVLFTKKEVSNATRLLLRPKFEPKEEDVFQQKTTEVFTVGKVAEERSAVLSGRLQLAEKERRSRMIAARHSAFSELDKDIKIKDFIDNTPFDDIFDKADKTIGDPEELLKQDLFESQAQFGRFTWYTQAALLKILYSALPENKERESIEKIIKSHLDGKIVNPETHRSLRVKLQGIINKYAKDRESIEQIVKAGELLDRALAISIGFEIELADKKHSQSRAVKELFNFFDKTMNAHMFDYFPFLIQPNLGLGSFDNFYDRDEKFKMATERHKWLYKYIRGLVSEKTPLADRSDAYKDRWLGNAEKGILALGIPDESRISRDEQFWYGYARLRDAVVCINEGWGMPEIFWDLDPAVLGADENGDFINVAIIYPYGNTTVPLAIEQAVKFEKEKCNLFITPFPLIARDGLHSRDMLYAKDAFMYVSKKRYLEMLIKNGVNEQQAMEMAGKVPEKGILVAIKFKEPAEVEVPGKNNGKVYKGAVAIHADYFHFTHQLRPDIEAIAPMVQPSVWEAATYLKGRMPYMLENSPVAFPHQFIWRMIRTKAVLKTNSDEAELKRLIREKVMQFLERHPFITELIVKPEKESGGRDQVLLPILDRDKRKEGNLVLLFNDKGEENINEIIDAIYEISLNDNAIVQGVLPSYVRRLYDEEFLKEDFVPGMLREAKTAVSLHRDPKTPLFNVFRMIVSKGKTKDFRSVMDIMVLSIQAIANVGRGAILREYRDDRIKSRYAPILRREMELAARESIKAQERYLKSHWPLILNEYLAVHRIFGERLINRLRNAIDWSSYASLEDFLEDRVKDEQIIIEVGKKLQDAGALDLDIHYEMGDWKDLWLVDENDNYLYVIDKDENGNLVHDESGNIVLLPLVKNGKANTLLSLKDENGEPIPIRDEKGNPIPVNAFNESGAERKISYYSHGGWHELHPLTVTKLESNPGAGQWRPYDRDALEKGAGVTSVFSDLAERAAEFKEKIKFSENSEAGSILSQLEPSVAEPSYYGADVSLSFAKPKPKYNTYEEYFEIAAAKLREDLNKSDTYKFTADDISAVLAYLAIELLSRKQIDKENIKDKIKKLLEDRQVFETMLDRISFAEDINIDDILNNSGYISMVEQMIAECITIGKEAIAVRISPYAVSAKQVIQPDTKVCGVIFTGIEPLFADTVNALQVESNVYLADEGHGRKLAFLGVHKNWLTDDGKAKRALISDGEGSVKEIEFSEPVKIDVANILHLVRETERKDHQEISEKLENAGVPQVNPYQKAISMDDKWVTHVVLSDNPMLNLPYAAIVSAQSPMVSMVEFVKGALYARDMFTTGKKRINIVVKPRHGTEGTVTDNATQEVLSDSFVLEVNISGQGKDINITENDAYNAAITLAQKIRDAGDDALVEEARGNITYKGKRLILRVLASWNGKGYDVTNGFAMVADDENTIIVSKSHGAKILDINEVLRNISLNNKPVPISQDVIDKIKAAQEEAALTLNAGMLAGGDIVLEAIEDIDGNIIVEPVIIEENSRPSALPQLRHIANIEEYSAAESKPEIATGLFSTLVYIADAAAVGAKGTGKVIQELPNAVVVIGDISSLSESIEYAQARATEFADIPDENILPITDIKTAKEQIEQLSKDYNIVKVVNYTGEDIAADITANFGEVEVITIFPVSVSAIGIGSSA